MPIDGANSAISSLRNTEFLQDLTGIKAKFSGSTNIPGMGSVSVTAQTVPERQGGQPTPVQAARSPATQLASTLGQSIMQALKAAWNYFMAPAPPLASAAHQEYARASVQKQAEAPFKEYVDGQKPTGAHEVFWKDLNRANYTVRSADGTGIQINVSSDPGTMSAQKMQSIDQVRLLCAGNEALMRAVTHMAHQGTLEAVQGALMPIAGRGLQMPDGSHGVPMMSEGTMQKSSYVLSAGPNKGEISIRAEYSLKGSSIAMTDGPTGMLKLDPAHSGYTGSIGIAVSLDSSGAAQVRVTDPLRVECSVRAGQP